MHRLHRLGGVVGVVLDVLGGRAALVDHGSPRVGGGGAHRLDGLLCRLLHLGGDLVGGVGERLAELTCVLLGLLGELLLALAGRKQ
jgi:hypothetical protein